MPRLGISSLAACLSADGHEVRHAVAARLGEKRLRDLMRTFKPDIVGYSIMTYDYESHVALNRELKKEFRFRAVFGGIHPTFLPEMIEDDPECDAICIGEGEWALAEFCRRIQEGGAYWQTPNFWVRHDGVIHRNPLRAGITDSLDTYIWSSHKGYVSQADKWNWLCKDFILSMLTKNKQKEKKAYTDFMREEESTYITSFFTRDNLPAILGAEEFIDRIRKQFYKRQCSRGIPQSRILSLPLDLIKQIVAGQYDTNHESLTVSRRGVNNEPRNMAIYLARKHSGKTLLEIGAAFNMSQYSSVSSVVNKMIKLHGQDKEIRKRVEGIEKTLLKGQT